MEEQKQPKPFMTYEQLIYKLEETQRDNNTASDSKAKQVVGSLKQVCFD